MQQQTLDEKGILQAIYAFMERADLKGNETKVYAQCTNYLESQFIRVEQKMAEAEKKRLEAAEAAKEKASETKQPEKLEPSLPNQEKSEEKSEVKQLNPEKEAK